LSEPQGDDLGLLLAVEHLAADPALGLAVEGGLEPARHQPLPKALHRSRPTVERVGDLGVRPIRPVRVGLEEDARSPSLLGRDPGSLQ
jgi:hypothetical protein